MRHRFTVRLIGIAATVATAATLVTASGAAAAPPGAPGEVPGDQPLPGYTINNPPIPPLVVDGAPTTVAQGTHEHAAYAIEVPARWNGRLVMWAHGFRGQGRVLTVDAPAFQMRGKLVEEGYAWASSSYYANGYDIRAGVLSTKALADHFGTLFPRPRQVLIAGVSMGGHIIGRSLEEYPRYYAGALPMCGVLGDHDLFDFFLDHNLTSQAIAGVDAYPIPADYQSAVVPQIQARLGLTGLFPGGPDTANELGRQFRAIMINRSGGPRPGDAAAFAAWKDFLYGLAAPATGAGLAQEPGQLSQNTRTTYTPNAPVEVNATVERVRAANPAARHSGRLTENPRIFGKPRVPVVSLHGLGDMFVPFSMEQSYARDVAKRHRSRLLVQRAIRTVGHCEFAHAEVARAFDDLVRWVDGGVRPAGDDVLTPEVVADPDYGCRFSDPVTFDSPPPGSSRRLFARCTT